jgi:hypothetical protein
MFDWGNLAANALWIFGCALALATLSFASWQASLHHQKLVARLSQPGYQRFLLLSGGLICVGQALLAQDTIRTVLWIVLGLLSAVGLASSGRRHSGKQ